MKTPVPIILITCTLFFINHASAQSPRREALAGIATGIADFSGENVTDVYYQIQPGFGFFVAEHVALGLFFNYSSFGYKNYPYSGFGIGPFLRVMPGKFFFQAQYELGAELDELFPYNKLGFAVGYALHLSKSFAIEPQLIYAGHNESGETFDFDGLGVGLALQFYAFRQNKN